MAKYRTDVDLGLIKQAQEGNADSAALLAARIQPQVYTYIHRMTLNSSVAEDLCQETMLRLVSNLRGLSFTHVPFFWAWVYKTALTRVQDHVRSERHKQKSSRAMENRMKAEGQSEDGTGLHTLERKELLASVWKAMQRLSLKHRNVLTLRCLDELSYAEIATVIGGSELSARLLFFRAKQSLQRQLARDGLGRSAVLSGLGVFAAATLHSSQKAAGAAAVSAASLHSGAGIAALGMATSKVAVVSMCTIVGLAAVATVTGNSRTSSGIVPADPNIETWADSERFAYPSKVLRTWDPVGYGFDLAWGKPPLAVRHGGPLEQALVGELPEDHPCLVLPPRHAVELGFDAPIVDGPGPDILIAGWGCRCQRVTLTDGARASYTLPLPPCEGNYGQFGVLSIDLALLKVHFEVRAVRIQGNHWFTNKDFYRLASVRARTATAGAHG
jgi:RNA polymerase sigma-70 factor (ECF subfamily)